jgi:hypothetical protein
VPFTKPPVQAIDPTGEDAAVAKAGVSPSVRPSCCAPADVERKAIADGACSGTRFVLFPQIYDEAQRTEAKAALENLPRCVSGGIDRVTIATALVATYPCWSGYDVQSRGSKSARAGAIELWLTAAPPQAR